MSLNTKIESLAVFCGSSMGFDVCYRQAVERFATLLAEKKITIVYGGASVGLMGMLADTALACGGNVIGVIPKLLSDFEFAHHGISECHIVESMHERKTMIASLSDAFVMLPGGAGTMEEFFEIYTWAQLHLHQKPCGILNVNNYYDPIIEFLDQTVAQGFMSQLNRNMIFVDNKIENLLESFAAYKPATDGRITTVETQ
jgi:uncharacterized protein (TIGR00730 family)